MSLAALAVRRYDPRMLAKKQTITDEERAQRLREAGKKAEVSDDPKAFERAFERVVKPPKAKSPYSPKDGRTD